MPKLKLVSSRQPKQRGTCPCGLEPVKYPKHGMGARCYNVYRAWDLRPDADRDRYKARLALAQLRQSWVDSSLITINHLKEKPRAAKAHTADDHATHSSRRGLRR